MIKDVIKRLHAHSQTAYVTALLLLLPLLFLGTRHSHDWGDDFAQYIHQAANIVNGIPQSETGFIYSQVNYIGPQAYPAGFPLMLAPLYAITGNSITAFILFISVVYVLTGLLILAYYRRYFSAVAALALMLIYVYNPQMILFKREVMSDLPFTALLIICLLCYEKWKEGGLWRILVISILAGLMVTVRPAGVVLIAAMLADQCINWYRKRRERNFPWEKLSMLLLIAPGMYFIINNLWLKIPSGGSLNDYLAFYFSGGFTGFIPKNFEHYIEVFRFQYVPESGILKGFSAIFGSAVLIFAATGFVKRVISGFAVVDWFFVFYTSMLLVFPNYDSAFRLMVPLGFILIMYAAVGVKEVSLLKNIPAWQKAMATLALALLLYMPGITNIYRWGFNTLDGPQSKQSAEVFEFIKSQVPHDSVVAFAKPRALALYGGCRSMADPITGDPTLMHLQLINNKASYILINRTLTAEPVLRYTRMMGPRLQKIFENRDFRLYRIIRAAPH